MIELDEICRRLSEVKKMGWIRTARSGPTGIGHTLEQHLQLSENNISSPDFGEIELKAQRENHTGMVSLFTFNRNAWRMPQLEAIKKYGSFDRDGRQGMYYTMERSPNSAGLFLWIDDDCISVRHVDGDIIAEWNMDDVVDRFNQKVRNVLLVKAKSEMRDGVEYFLFNRARLLSGGINKSILKNQMENEKLKLDLRLHDKGTSARNHGTGFRAVESDMDEFYTKNEEIDF